MGVLLEMTNSNVDDFVNDLITLRVTDALCFGRVSSRWVR